MRILVGILLLGGTLASDLAWSDENYCGDVLRYAARDYSSEAQRSTVLKKTYEKYCNGSSAKSEDSLDVGFDAVIEAVPVGFKLGSGSRSEKASHFCRTFDDELRANFERYSESALVSQDAVKAWSDCIRIYSEGVRFNPIIKASQATIVIEKRSSDPIRVRGIQYDSGLLNCSVPDDDKKQSRTAASITTEKQLVDRGAWSVSCDRLPVVIDNQNTYPEADITINTTRGAFGVTLPRDARLSPETAQGINERIDSVLAELKVVGARKASLECKHLSAESPRTRFPEVEVKIPDVDKAASYKLAGGGCELAGPEPGQSGGRAHNGPITASRPNTNSDGWYCRGMDPPNIPLDFQVRAWVTYCKTDTY